jgi:DNA-directed RNA polymerase specialized sigma24 family protein
MQINHDDILAARAKAGDRRAADQLARAIFSRYASAIAARGLAIGDAAEAASLANLSFVAALRAWRPGEAFAGFFIGQLESRCLTVGRARARHARKKAAYAAALDPAACVTAPVETAPDAARIFALATRVLTPGELRVFSAARATEEPSEIARRCGVSRQVATRALDLACAKIRNALAAQQPVGA